MIILVRDYGAIRRLNARDTRRVRRPLADGDRSRNRSQCAREDLALGSVSPVRDRSSSSLERLVSIYRRLADRHLIERVSKVESGRWAPKLYRLPILVPLFYVLTAVLAWSIFVLLARLSGFNAAWWPPRSGSIPDDKRGALVRDTLSVLALFAAVAAAIYAYRKQRVEEAAGYRADAEALSKRYQDAANQLGHAKAAVRLAGVYAMARLADDWPEQRQTCVDVLCAYLRMPFTQEEEDETERADSEVRDSILNIIADHLQQEALVASWSNLSFNFRGATFKDLRFDHSVFAGGVNFGACRFRGECAFNAVIFESRTSFDRCRVDHRLTFESAKVKGLMTLDTIRVAADASLSMRSPFVESGNFIELRRSRIEGNFTIVLTHWPLDQHQGTIILDSARVSDQGIFRLQAAYARNDGGNRGGGAEKPPLPEGGWVRVRLTEFVADNAEGIQVDQRLFDAKIIR
jgi:hypothetical protein